MNSFGKWALLIVIALMLQSTQSARAQAVGTSCADCTNYSAAFSIENKTGMTISYRIRWGEAGDWKNHTLESGRTLTHSFPLGENPKAKIQPPYINFTTAQFLSLSTERRLEFNAVRDANVPAERPSTEPKRYYFEYDGPSQLLNLKAR